MSEPQAVLYHYTTGSVFQKILKSGALLPDRTEPENEKEVPTVTFSSNPDWERTRYRVGKLPNGKLVMMNKLLLDKFDKGLIRIVVPRDLAPLDWHAMRDQIGMSSQAMKGIYDLAVSVGARTSEWFATTEVVPESAWIAVERFVDGNWVELPQDERPEAADVDENSVVDIALPVVPVETAEQVAP